MADKPSVKLPIKLPITLPNRGVRYALRPEYSSSPLGRWAMAVLLGLLGIRLGLAAGLFGGGFLDEALGYPLRGNHGVLPFGNLKVLCTIVGPFLGATLGALWGHRLRKGQGTFATAFCMTLLGVGGGVLLVARLHVPIILAALVPPLFAATGLEFWAKDDD